MCGAPYLEGGNYTLNCGQSGHPCAAAPLLGFASQEGVAYLVGEKPSPWPGKNYTASDLVAVLDLCVTPCMRDTASGCCKVPLKIAPKFACCRELCACPDQGGPGASRRRAQPVLDPREAQVSVSVSVTVEETSSSLSVYDALLRCLQNLAKLDAMCLTGSSGH